MKQRMKRVMAFMLALAMVFSILISDNYTITVEAASKCVLTISKKNLTLVKGQKETLVVTGTNGEKVKWTSSNPKVATVSKKGKVTAKKTGKCVVRAKVGKTKVSCTVEIKGTGLNKTELSLGIKDTTKIKVLNNKKKIRWSSSNRKVAVVDSKGKITAKKSGTTVIKAKVGGNTYKCNVTVKKTKISTKDPNGNYKFEYKPEVKATELKSEKDYQVKPVFDGLQVSIKRDKKTKEIEAGDVIVLPDKKGEPSVAMKVDTVRNSGSKLVLVGEPAEITDVFDSIDVDFKKTSSLDGLEYNKDIVKSVKNTTKKQKKTVQKTGTKSTTRSESTGSTSVGDGKTLTLLEKENGGNGKLTGTITLSAPVISGDIDIDLQKDLKKSKINKLDLSVQEIVTSNLDAENKYSKTLYLAHQNIPIKAGFSVDLTFYLEINAKGEVHVVNTTTFTNGIEYNNKKLKPVNSVTTSFEGTYAQVDASAYLNPVLDLRWGGYWDEKDKEAKWEVEVLEAKVFLGPAFHGKAEVHDVKPNLCVDLQVWIHADVSVDQEYGLGFIFKDAKINTSWTLLDNNASNKMRKTWHFEDGKRVTNCTAGNKPSVDDMSSDESNDNTGENTVVSYGTELQLESNWDYNLDMSKKAIYLTNYKGSSSTVTVYGGYKINGQNYRTYIDTDAGRVQPFYNKRKSINEIIFENGSVALDCHSLFYYCEKLSGINLDGLDTSNVKDMAYMFAGCSVSSLDLSSLDTSNVVDMTNMFFSCSDLVDLNLDGVDTRNVEYMYGMFWFCSTLERIDVSDFNTSKVSDMTSMFSNCSSLKSLDISCFDTSNVIDMGGMFSACSSLKSLDLSSFNTSKVTDMGGLLQGCSSLESVNLSSFNTNEVTDMGSMFQGCSSLESVNLSSFNTSKVTSMSFMFRSCSSMTSIKVSSGWTTEHADTVSMFDYCGCDSVTIV